MLTRFAVACGWLVYQLRRAFGLLPSVPSVAGVIALAAILVALAAMPIVAAGFERQPQDVEIGDILASDVTDPDGWVRLRGEIEPLAVEATVEGAYALLHDAEEPSLAIVLLSAERLGREPSATITGHLAPFAVAVPGYQPVIAPGEAAGQRRVVADQIVEVDDEPPPVRSVAWGLVLLPLLGVGLLGLGLWIGYPVFRPTREIDLLAQPLAPGERLPLILAGRLGDRRVPLDDPSDALLLVAQGPRGGLLTVQLLPPEGGYVAPVSVGPGWTRGKLGYVYTLREEVPALAVEAEGIEAILMFARVAERNKAAALVALEA